MTRAIVLLALAVWLLAGCSDDDGSAVDVTAPSSAVAPLPEEVTSVPFTVSWSGTDSGSGIKHYDVQSKDGDGVWTDWLVATTLTAADFTGEDDHTYYFRCRAMDNAGNREEYPASADASTTVDLGPASAWEKTFGGVMSEAGWSVEQTGDGGYIAVGYTNSSGAGGRDVYAVKVSSTGSLEWEETYGGSEDDGGLAVVEAADGGYAIAGYTRSFGASVQDIYLVKVNSNGGLEWGTQYGASWDDIATCIRRTPDGGYVLAGQAYSPSTGWEFCLLKVASDGGFGWYRTFGGTLGDFSKAVEPTADDGYMVVGWTLSYGVGGGDVYLVKVDSLGNPEWEKTYGGASADYGLSLQTTADGGYIIGGQTSSFGAGEDDMSLLKIDSGGEIEWYKAYGGGQGDFGSSALETADGGYVIVGETVSFGAGDADVYLVRTDANGNLEWSQTFGGASGDGGYGLGLADDGYIITGYTSSSGAGETDLYLIKVDEP